MNSRDRESKLQDELVDLFLDVIKKFRFKNLEFSKVERDFPIDSRKADLVLFSRNGPFLIIETKKMGEAGKNINLTDPLAPAVIGQAISYVGLYKKNNINVPFFATVNPKSIAVFRTPENVLDFIDFNNIKERNYEKVIKPGYFSKLISEDYLIIREQLKLNIEYIENLLDKLANDYMKSKILKISLDEAIIEEFRLFVDEISDSCEGLLNIKINEDSSLKQEIEKIEKEEGSKIESKNLARMMSYVFMNKLIFYKVLEAKFKLPKLIYIDTSSNIKFQEGLKFYFDKVEEVTKDFEPIFKTGVYDLLPIPDDKDFMERINDFISFLDQLNIEEIGDLTGYIYEELIPPKERHYLGQFYTPLPICELISKWAIRSSDDKILDPGVGSGGFILQAYKRLLNLKTGDNLSNENLHKKILDQLFAVDINPFPAHITAMNLAMKNVRAPVTNMNIIVRDFFQISPNQDIIEPFVIKTAGGDIQRKIRIPKLDVVIGNPPYTRYDEISENTKKSIKNKLKNTIKKYKLILEGSRAAQNPGIYIFWIIHATNFLKEGGRLGMIISNSWLQSDYGIKFSNFLLDNYKIKAIIDFQQRLFQVPMISTLVILLERCSNEIERNINDVYFIFVKNDTPVENLLKIINDGEKIENISSKKIKQSKLPKNSTWIRLFESSFEDFEKILDNDLLIEADKIFDISRGNVTWFMKKLEGNGADPFFYLKQSNIKIHNLDKYIYKYIYPALTSPRNSEYFTFTENDWMKLNNKNAESYMFVCHKSFSRLPTIIKNYIKWGTTECRVSEKRGGGVICSQTVACKQREKIKDFYGWYDLGEIKEVPIFAIYHARYKTRFVLCKFNAAISNQFVTLFPKIELNEDEIKALLAYLNSSISQYYIETRGTPAAKGPIGLEVKVAKDMRIINIKKLSKDQIMLLKNKFNELEEESRKIGGSFKKDQIEKLKPKIYDIDMEIAKILNIQKNKIEELQKSVETLIERRIGGSRESTIKIIKGDNLSNTKLKNETIKSKKKFKSLTDFM
ncbi:MAG: HsdM family class I SAM-dependent methyltransferase [Minisyncoccia bacterium]|jgi:methylase of polypeptide subunit release factors